MAGAIGNPPHSVEALMRGHFAINAGVFRSSSSRNTPQTRPRSSWFKRMIQTRWSEPVVDDPANALDRALLA
jgi:hypothetical protein